jgi:hypothetical protein
MKRRKNFQEGGGSRMQTMLYLVASILAILGNFRHSVCSRSPSTITATYMLSAEKPLSMRVEFLQTHVHFYRLLPTGHTYRDIRKEKVIFKKLLFLAKVIIKCIRMLPMIIHNPKNFLFPQLKLTSILSVTWKIPA